MACASSSKSSSRSRRRADRARRHERSKASPCATVTARGPVDQVRRRGARDPIARRWNFFPSVLGAAARPGGTQSPTCSPSALPKAAARIGAGQAKGLMAVQLTASQEVRSRRRCTKAGKALQRARCTLRGRPSPIPTPADTAMPIKRGVRQARPPEGISIHRHPRR
ncbi:MAG: hypothetical protein JWO62_2026 [Acidimicrobiaceae bacterium]|nr:hypothetical protein [Acidimicrobiaceae bacterium]